MTHPTYPHLLEPITLGAGPDALTLRNRVVMGSMHTGLEDHPWDIDKLGAFFAERARGGVGLIITVGYAPTKDLLVGNLRDPGAKHKVSL